MFQQPARDKALVVAALRSGKYKQGREVLKYTGYPEGPRYCCLGVMQEVLDGKVEEEGPDANGDPIYCLMPSQEWCERHNITINGFQIANGFPLVPPEFHREEFDAEGFPVPTHTLTAPVLNDSVGLTFPQIADLWEYFVEGV